MQIRRHLELWLQLSELLGVLSCILPGLCKLALSFCQALPGFCSSCLCCTCRCVRLHMHSDYQQAQLQQGCCVLCCMCQCRRIEHQPMCSLQVKGPAFRSKAYNCRQWTEQQTASHLQWPGQDRTGRYTDLLQGFCRRQLGLLSSSPCLYQLLLGSLQLA